MSQEIVPIPPRDLDRAGFEILPAMIARAGERAAWRFIEFFTANIRNRNTRAAALFKIAASMAFDVEMCPASSSVESRSKTPLRKTHALGSPMYGLTNSG